MTIKKTMMHVAMAFVMVGALFVAVDDAEARPLWPDGFPKPTPLPSCEPRGDVGTYCSASTDIRMDCSDAENWAC